MSADTEHLWNQLVARAWADPAFKARLLADPATVLKENGVVVPAGIEFRVVENTDTVIHLTIPLKPPPEELSEEELNRAAGGQVGCWHCSSDPGRCTRCHTHPHG